MEVTTKQSETTLTCPSFKLGRKTQVRVGARRHGESREIQPSLGVPTRRTSGRQPAARKLTR